MVQELKVPAAGESIQEVQIGQWLKKEGDWVQRDEPVVALETDKASMDVPAPVSGVLEKILKREGDAANVGEAIAVINDQQQRDGASTATARAGTPSGPLPPPRVVMPAAQRLLAEYGIQAQDVQASGPEGRLLKEDVLRHIEQLEQQRAADAPTSDPSVKTPADGQPSTNELASTKTEPAETRPASSPPERHEKRVPMTLIRRRIAERLVQAQQAAALLTTFNEVDMSEVIQLRKRAQDKFREKYGVKLGFMSFFTTATVEALSEFPALNAEISDREIVYRNYCDMGIAIGSAKGLVVPVLRDAQQMGFAEIEKRIADFAERAGSNKIRPEELEGGTFTITNGGVFGSLLSTPIVNAPQSGVLGLHTIQQRPVVRDGQIVIRDMMYVALTYDHRIVDGREAVTFLRRIKELIEEPARLLLGV